jgi:hypoxanthine-DNA glycosylase
MPGFEPIIGSLPHTLILGSMPSVKSLQHNEYYAHPQNSFWWIVSHVYGFATQLTYAERCEKLRDAGVALWDVLHDCERAGSADNKISRGSEVVNDFGRFSASFSNLRLIAFNGRAAETVFMRCCDEFLGQVNVTTVCLPSTSPAYASMPREEKLERWKTLLLNAETDRE